MKASKIIKYKMSQEELEKLLKSQPILSPREALIAEMYEKNVDRFERELKDTLAAIAMDRSGPY